jgi:hypothetical protein
MSTKTYQYNNGFTKYQAVITIDGKTRSIDFSGGRQMPFAGGKFTTSDKKIQKAIEARKDFGTKLIILNETGGKETATPKAAAPESIPEVKGTVVPDINNMQSARSWLAKNIEGLTFAMMPNKKAVLETMAAQNPPVTFPDWNI